MICRGVVYYVLSLIVLFRFVGMCFLEAPQEQSLQLDNRSLLRILNVTRQLGAPIDLEAMLNQVVEATLEVLEADRATVFLYEPATNELYSKVATGAGRIIRFPADQGIAGECAQSRKMINVPDCYADARFNAEIDKQTGYKTRCLLTIPLVGMDDQLVGVMQVLNKHDGVFEQHDENLATALAAQAAVALQRAKLYDDFLVKQKLERDLSLARDIQQNIIPKSMPELNGFELAGWSRPAEQTGGDIYDVLAIDDHRVLLLLCDATGHGVGPALSVTQVRAMFRMAVRLNAALDDMVDQVNDQLVDDLADNRFVTVFVGLLDTHTGEVMYHACGQGPLLHYHAQSEEVEVLSASTVPMGILTGVPLDPPSPIRLAPGDILALISDGVFEYLNHGNEQFGDVRVGEVIQANQNLPMTELIGKLDSAVEQFSAGYPQQDDMTVTLVKRLY